MHLNIEFDGSTHLLFHAHFIAYFPGHCGEEEKQFLYGREGRWLYLLVVVVKYTERNVIHRQFNTHQKYYEKQKKKKQLI